MLTIEEIKQAVKFADGFFYDYEKPLACYFFGYEQDYSIRIGKVSEIDSGYYELFLDRVIHGMNRIGEIGITTFENVIAIFDITSVLSRKLFQTRYNGTTKGIREAREEAIRFALDGMR